MIHTAYAQTVDNNFVNVCFLLITMCITFKVTGNKGITINNFFILHFNYIVSTVIKAL
ncbi:hypothetical protein FM106_04335 [Brachybacterium faecium]|nr:hypothetical protein FM106_04335 [Brachybacterium faecium]